MTMYLVIFVLSLVAVTPSLNSVVKTIHSDCTSAQYRCPDGSCLAGELRCDGTPHCVGGADEARCYSSPDGAGAPGDAYSLSRRFEDYRTRDKRQTRCTGAQWRCRSGQCIGSDGRCDGVQNCADGSDEAHALCRNTPCPDHLFRCAYGACVDGYAKCDKEKNCADNSDELHPDCFPGNTTLVNGQFKCADGSRVSSTVACDGHADCTDGSDETVRACGSTRCHSIHFQCAYGACVDTGSDCDDKVDCADGSDEADDLCNRMGTGVTTTTTARPVPQPGPSGNCILPPYPAHGRYAVDGSPGARPGQALEAASLTISCDAGYRVLGNTTYVCYGQYGWFGQMPSCARFCRLNPHKSVTYRCLLGTTGGSEDCPLFVPSGTEVVPTCNFPNYYSRFPLQYMRCRDDGQWNNIEICEPECGKITPDGEAYVIDGVPARRGEFPWHVGIYRKDVTPYMQVCGGSIVSSTLVISAAHCFYTDAEKLRPARKYAVAAGKIYRPWDESHDEGAQKSDVSDIKITERYRGSSTNYQEDIALVFVSKPFEYQVTIRPVCLDFDPIFNGAQLSLGNYGRVAGWGLTKENGAASQILLTVNLPYILAGTCIDSSPPGFREYITGDKFCAGYTNGTSLCKGDSGGGLAFASVERSATRYYLRGIVSTGPRNLEFTSCESHYYTTFTELYKHEMFIRPHYNRS